MAHVEELQLLTLAVGPGGIVSGGDLPPARDSGLAGEELIAGVCQLPGLGLGHGARANHREVALEDVQELGELVQGGRAQDATHARDARIVIHLLLKLPLPELLLVEVALGVLVGVDVHGANLVDVEVSSALANALLEEDGRAGRLQARGQTGKRDGNGQDDGHAGGEHEIENPFDDSIHEPSRTRQRPRNGSRSAVGHLGVDGREGSLVKVRRIGGCLHFEGAGRRHVFLEGDSRDCPRHVHVRRHLFVHD